MPQLNINNDAAVIFTNKLERLHRSALPVAIRQTLNSVAFDLKKKSIPSESQSTFVNRQKNFFKATSRVEMARGFNLATMKSTVGFIGAEKNQAIENLEKQEKGGKIGGRSFIPMVTARISKNKSKMVVKANRLKSINKIVDARKGRIRGKNPGQRFAKAVHKADKGGFVLSPYKNEMFLWRVNSLNRTSEGNFKLTLLYSYKKGRSVKVESTKFMETASLKSNRKMYDFFEIEAKKQIKRLKG